MTARPRGRPAPATAIRALLAASLLAAAPVLPPAPASAQSASGTTGAAVLQLPGGGRAAGMAGAYVAADDGDAIFYNPAGAAWIGAAGMVSYQRHVDQIGFGTAAAAFNVGPVLMLSAGFLDFGSVAEVIPDPAFGGQRGEETGRSVDASELVVKAGVAIRLPGGRAAVGGSFGVLYTAVAETGRTGSIFDFGAHYRLGRGLTAGAALRNAGDDLDGARLAAAPLPSEVRAGLAWRPAPVTGGVRLSLHGDAVQPLNGGDTGFATGVEAAAPAGMPGLDVAVRVGYNGALGAAGVGRLHLGAGLSHGSFGLDYAFQDMSALGAVHRFGVRWVR